MPSTNMSKFFIINPVIRSRHSSCFTVTTQKNCWHWFGHKSISNSKFLSHLACFLAATNAINLDSIMECEIQVYFFEAQETPAPLRVKIHPEVDFILSSARIPTSIAISS